MNENITSWDNVLNDLVSLYRDIERKSLSLPIFSLTPFFVFLWSTFKFYICFILDIFLLIPMNLFIFLRNVFPGRWRYRSFSWPYIKYVVNWIWRGELPTAPFVVIQPMVSMMVSIHAHNRFRIILKYLQLDGQLNDEQRERLNTKLARILENYKRPNILSYIYTFVLPITGPMIEGYKWLFPEQTPVWLSMAGIFFIQYTIFFVISAVMVKRALMLGGEERAVYFPGSLASNQYYDREKQILSSAGIKKTEFPLDALLSFINFPIAYLSMPTQFQFYEKVGLLHMPTQDMHTTQIIFIEWAIFILITFLAVYRRKVNGRE